MIFESRHRRFLAEINIIPLVDVVLVLLIIFMVTAPMLYRGMDITLPTSSSNTIKPEERLVLTIERDQKVYLDKDLVPLGLWRQSSIGQTTECRCIRLPASRPRCGVWNGGAGHGWSQTGGHRKVGHGDRSFNPRGASELPMNPGSRTRDISNMSAGTFPQMSFSAYGDQFSSGRYMKSDDRISLWCCIWLALLFISRLRLPKKMERPLAAYQVSLVTMPTPPSLETKPVS